MSKQNRVKTSFLVESGPPPSAVAGRIREFILHTVPDEFGLIQWPSATADTRFNEIALELFAAQFSANRPFRAFCVACDATPETVSDWRSIPAVPTAAFKELDLTCLSPAARTTVFHSSGTSEQRLGRNFHNIDSLTLYAASLQPWFAAKVLAVSTHRNSPSQYQGSNSTTFLALTPPRAAVPHSSLVYMFDCLVRTFGTQDSAFVGRLDPRGNWELHFEFLSLAVGQLLRIHQPVTLLGTAFNFVHLLDYLSENNIQYRLPAGSCAVETGGYKGRSREMSKTALHHLITRHLGIGPSQIFSEYGMCELGSQAYDQPRDQDRRFQFPPWARIQIVSPETGKTVPVGQPGLIRVCDLANIESVLRVQTGDLGVAFADDRFELLGRAPAQEPRGCSLFAV